MLLATGTAGAAITLAGNFQTGTPTPSITLSSPITLSITTTGQFAFLVFDDWNPNNNGNQAADFASSGQTLSYRVNGGAVQTVGILYVQDRGYSQLALTVNDGYFDLTTPISVVAGQTLTILPGTSTYSGVSNNFNTPPSPFTGNAFASTDTGGALSSLASVGPVPEPSTAAMLGLGAAALGLALRGRRRLRG